MCIGRAGQLQQGQVAGREGEEGIGWAAPGVGARLWGLHWEAVGRRGGGAVCV